MAAVIAATATWISVSAERRLSVLSASATRPQCTPSVAAGKGCGRTARCCPCVRCADSGYLVWLGICSIEETRMAAEDFMESEVALAAAATAATAAIFSPRVRDVMRKGAVYGVAGVLTAGRAVTGVARGAADGVAAAMPSGRSTRPAAASSSTRSRAASKASRSRSTAARPKPRTKPASRSTRAPRSGGAASSGSASTPASSGS
jgi:hypothetical protein